MMAPYTMGMPPCSRATASSRVNSSSLQKKQRLGALRAYSGRSSS
jgi:hypothetical protein